MQRRPVLKTLAMLALPGLGARSVAQDAWPTRSVKIISSDDTGRTGSARRSAGAS